MSSPLRQNAHGQWFAPALVGGAVILLLAQTVTVGADALWLVAMGRTILREGGIPEGIPFAAAPSQGWPNVPVLGELLFAVTDGLGSWGLPVLQLAVDAAVLVLVAVGASRLGAGGLGSAVSMLVAALGMLPALGVIRAQLLSLVPFVLLLLLLRSEEEVPSRRIWLLVPLVALWGNLHGAVLAGVAIAGCYLLFSRLRRTPLEAILVGVAALAALAVTPAHVRSGAYYLGALSNEAARRGSELWSAPDLANPTDLLMAGAAATLFGLAMARRRPVWEYFALAGLILATFTSARHGVWLVVFLSGPAAAGLTKVTAGRTATKTFASPAWRRLTALVTLASLVLAGTALWSRAAEFGEDEQQAREIKRVVGDQPVLAPGALAESLAAGGVLVWISNPIDAFSRADQAAYLDFVGGGGPGAARALAAAEFVVAESGSPQARLAADAGFVLRSQVGAHQVMERGDRP